MGKKGAPWPGSPLSNGLARPGREIREGVLRPSGQDSRRLAPRCEAGVQRKESGKQEAH